MHGHMCVHIYVHVYKHVYMYLHICSYLIVLYVKELFFFF